MASVCPRLRATASSHTRFHPCTLAIERFKHFQKTEVYNRGNKLVEVKTPVVRVWFCHGFIVGLNYETSKAAFYGPSAVVS